MSMVKRMVRNKAPVPDALEMLEQLEGIAGQACLIALNAAIESAGAGESGRGLAAVAADALRVLLAGRDRGKTGEVCRARM